MIPNSVSQYLSDNYDRHIESLKEFLRFPSVANIDGGDADPCGLCANWLVDYLNKLGMDAKILPTSNKPNVLATLHVSDHAPTLLIYGHYDVQPPDPLELWESDPFEPEIRDGYIYARGANDDKGQLFTHLAAIEAWMQCGGLPINVKVFAEGEEEVGSPDLEGFITRHAEALSSDAIVVSDSSFFADEVPSITYSLRGLAYVQLTVTGPSADIHSGEHGGAITNPINALTKMVAGMHDANGRITLPGFYDDVVELSDQERQGWANLPFDADKYASSMGTDALGGGENAFSDLERLWSRPTLDCNGISGGYAGPGSKTIIPSQASVKISMRIVPNQRPEKIIESIRQYVAENTPPGVTCEMEVFAGARPVMMARDSASVTAASAALEEAFGKPAAMVRCGASVPVTELFQRILGTDAVMMGFGLPGDRLHSPNERFALKQFTRGALASAAFIANLASAE
ncbi:MAG: dipeptidase [Phycisphaerales bacterium]|jgi:acetylornithine deacetylase/succinyl-diaminopimelate desuccinylase-like protein|nr:dipeptidase [Phycisphaerales bacterium]